MSNRKAFTLIELLVTIVLFSLLLVTMLFSFRFISLNIKNINNTNPQNAMNYNLLKKSFNSIYYYIVTNYNEVNIDKKFYLYFKGEKKRCRFITKSSMFHKNDIVIAELKYENNKIWYKENKIFDKNIDYKRLDDIKMNRKILLFDNIKNFNLIYHFNKNINNKLINHIPQFIVINFKYNEKEYDYLFHIKSDNTSRLENLKLEHVEYIVQ